MRDWGTGIRCAAVTGLGVILAIAVPSQEARPAEKLTVCVIGFAPGQAGLFTAKEAGFFAAQGLDVDLVFFASGTEGVQALVSGTLSVCSGAGGPPLVNAVLAGAPLVWVGELLGTMPYTLVVSSDIAAPADLKGKRLGINRFGATPDFAIRFALRRLGLDPARDVSILQIGGQSERLAALKAGAIDGTVMSPPSTVLARKLGFRELTSMAGLGLKYPFEAIAVTKAFARERPDTVRRLLTALVLGTHRFKTDRDEGIRALRKYLKTDDMEALGEAYAFYAPIFPRKPFVPLEGVQMILDELGRTDPRAKTARPEEFVDTRFVRELDESGFLDSLYKR